MKQRYTWFFVLILILVLSCQRSQFSTITRHSRNGRISYANRYSTQKIRLVKIIHQKKRMPPREAQDLVPGTNDLIASSSNVPPVIFEGEGSIVPAQGQVLTHESCYGIKTRYTTPDSMKQVSSEKRKPRVYYAKIKFRNGHEETGKIISQTHDTLKYMPVSERGVVRVVRMEQVDTLLPDTRKTEKLGLAGFILSLLGLVPIVGIPFAILALIFGLRSLKKIKAFPERFKGRGFAMASLIIGSVEIICYIIAALVGIAVAVFTVSSGVARCTGG